MELATELERLRQLEVELARRARAAGDVQSDREARRICEAIAMQSEARASSAEAWAREYGEARAQGPDVSVVLDLTEGSGGELEKGSGPHLMALRTVVIRSDRAWAAVGRAARASGRSQLMDLVGAARADLHDALTWLDLRPEVEVRTRPARRLA